MSEYKPVRMVRKPTTMTCMVWDGTKECTDTITEWLAKEMSITTEQVRDGVFFERASTRPTARLWCFKSLTHVEIHDGDAVVQEADKSGFYPIEKSVLEVTYVGIPDDV